MRQQRIGGDVEGHAEEHVGGALVELAGEPAVGDVELEQAVAGRQRHRRGCRPGSRPSRSCGGCRDWSSASPRPRGSDRCCRRRPSAMSATGGRRPGPARRPRRPIRPRSRRRWSLRYSVLVSPARNHISSWMIDLRCSFLVVTSGKPAARSKRIWWPNTLSACRCRCGRSCGRPRAHAAHQVEILVHGTQIVRFWSRSAAPEFTPAAARVAAPPR